VALQRGDTPAGLRCATGVASVPVKPHVVALGDGNRVHHDSPAGRGEEETFGALQRRLDVVPVVQVLGGLDGIEEPLVHEGPSFRKEGAQVRVRGLCQRLREQAVHGAFYQTDCWDLHLPHFAWPRSTPGSQPVTSKLVATRPGAASSARRALARRQGESDSVRVRAPSRSILQPNRAPTPAGPVPGPATRRIRSTAPRSACRGCRPRMEPR